MNSKSKGSNRIYLPGILLVLVLVSLNLGITPPTARAEGKEAPLALTDYLLVSGGVLTVSKAGTGSGTVNSSPGGISCGVDCSETFDYPAVVKLTAAAAAGSTFTGWSGACGGVGDCWVTMSVSRSVTATFTQNPPGTQSLTVLRLGGGSGTVTSTPVGISCGSDCLEFYTSGTVVKLTAAPAAGSTFTGWSGACGGTGFCWVTMSAARLVKANFVLTPAGTNYLGVSKAGAGSGLVYSYNLWGINCGTDCSEFYTSGTVVQLMAAPAVGSTFTGWSGACGGTGHCWVTMSAVRYVKANFVLTPPGTNYLGVTKAGAGSGTVISSPGGISCGSDCSEFYTSGTVVKLTAMAAGGSAFSGWSGACGGTGFCWVTMSAVRYVKATFSLNPGSLPSLDKVCLGFDNLFMILNDPLDLRRLLD